LEDDALYVVQVTSRRDRGGWESIRSTPTFFLDENIQGIVDEAHAARIVRGIVDPHGTSDSLSICAVKL
jgi:hypothetical protein